MDQEVRVRFAPSPTGPLHIGGVRTALYNYLFARQKQGKFIIRIEDTDQTRYVADAENYILESLKWLGLKADESPQVGGAFAPYRQSERKELYGKYAWQLVEEGKAYIAFDTADELEAMRTRLEAAKANNTSYNALVRREMTNSFTLSKEEVQERIDRGDDYVIRINMPLKEDIRFQDEVFGWIVVHSSTLDDKVLLKSDGMPTYHLANVVDDYLMKISHVIRGKEWLPSTPLHVLLYQYLGWEKEMPRFAHLPLLLKPNGKGKLSKRDGLKFGFPVFPMEWMDKDEEGNPVKVMGFRDEGYLPDALLNFLAFLGWNPGTEQELFSLEALVEAFSIERVAKSDAIFDVDKSKWFNEQYVKELSPKELAQLALSSQEKTSFADQAISEEKMKAIAELMQARITFPNEIWREADYFFQLPQEYDAKTLKKKWKADSRDFLLAYAALVTESAPDWKADTLKSLLEALLEQRDMKIGRAMPGLRLALTGRGGGPDLMSIMEILGKEESLHRFEIALEKFPVNA